MQSKRLPILFLLFMISYTYGHATFSSGNTATEVATQITGPGSTITSPVIVNGAGTQVGIYSDGIANAGLQLDSGIILTTGTVTESFSTNSATGISLGPGLTFSDGDLTAIDANAINDVVIFEFDATLDALATVLTIDYQFMSDEYNEYVCSAFNDIFGYFISGPGITGTQNIALVPGTSNAVTIASINNGSVGGFGDIGDCIDLTQSALFTDNSGGAITMEYDGITNKIRASATGLTPGETYTVKFAIADVADGAFDSAILIDVISGFPDDDDDGIANDVDLDDDNDGIYDTVEDANLDNDNNPLSNPTDTDADGIPNYLDLDSDGDGIPDNVEAQTTNGYISPGSFTDTNLDGVNDVYAGGLTPVNTDGTDNPDYLDTDSDNDNTDDTTEASITFSGNIGNNGLDNGLESIDDYSDPNGTLDDPTTLPDSDSDVGSGGDVDYRDAITLGDNDSDGVSNPLDVDDDNDGILDIVELDCSNPAVTFVTTVDAFWNFDNNTNDSANSNNENGAVAVTYSPNAIEGTASILFDGATSIRYSQDGGFMESAYTNISFSAWIIPSSLTGTSIIYEEGGGTHGAAMWLNNNILTFSARNNTVQVDVTHPTPLSLDGQWHHVAGTFDNGDLIVYLDGVPSSTVAAGFTNVPRHGNNGGVGGEVGNGNPIGSSGFFSGYMDAVRYSNSTTWSPTDINTEAQNSCNASLDTDSDGIPNYLDLDSDGDGIPDNVEAQTTNAYIAPNNAYDATGLDTAYSSGLTPVNTDGTDNPDYLDTDSDNEGSDDTVEAGLTLAGILGSNGLDTNIATTADYSDVNGTINDPTTLPDSDSDLGGGGDVDFRDDTVDINLGSGNLLWLRSDIQAATSLWEDQSGNNFDATSGVTADPDLNSNQINFYPAFNFNGSTQSLTITGGILGTASYNSLWVYIVSSTDVIQNSSIFREEIASGERLGSHLPWGDSNLYFDFGTTSPTGGRINAAWGSSINTFNLWNFGNSNATSNPASSNKSLYRDGLLFATNNTFDATVQGNSQDFQIATDGTNFHDGKIAEMIIFADVPTSLEQQKVQSYLAIKYGITLDTSDNDAGVTEGDYIASDETTKYWDFTANSTYHNDVAGIGRDDTQVLNNKQSKSANSDRIVTMGLGQISVTNAANGNTFSADKQFLVWGNDNTALGATSTSGILCATDLRLDRNWKIVETGSVGTVEIAAVKSTIDTYLVNASRPKAMIVADDETYTTNLEFVSLTEETVDGVAQYTGTYDFNGTKFFTFVEVGGITWSGSTSSWAGGQGAGGAPSTNVLDNNQLLTIDAEGTGNQATLPENAQVGCVWVTAGSKLMVPTDQFLQIADQLFLEGEIRLLGSAQLVQTHAGASQVTGSGNLYVDQNSPLTSIYRYNYWTSPVNSVSGTGFTVGEVMKDGTLPTTENSTPLDINFTSGLDGALTSPITISNYWIYGYLNGLSDATWVQLFDSGTFEISEGYIMKGPGAAQNYTFVGSPNDGDYTTSISAGFLSLLGNPYPSAIDSQVFFTDNNGVVDALYFWEHQGDSNNHNTNGYIGGYGMLNASMSVAGVAPSNDDTGGQGAFVYTAPGRYIPIGQGFFVEADGAGTVTFNNSQRVFERETGDGGSDSEFFRNNSNGSNTNEEDLAILKFGLDYINDEGDELHRQIGISFKEGNTRFKDTGYDSDIFDLNATDLYFSFREVRQGLAIAGIEEISDDTEFPIAIQTSNDHNITLRIDEIYNIDRDVFLEDKVTGQIYDLEDPIELNLPIGTYKDRFYVKFGESSLSNTTPLVEDTLIYVDQNLEELIVKNIPNSLDLNSVKIYNILGQEVRKFETSNPSQEHTFSVKGINTNVYIVHLEFENYTLKRKIVIEYRISVIK